MGYPYFIKTELEDWMENFNFSTAIKIRFGETDAFGHVNNVSYFTYFEQARLDYLEHLGLIERFLNHSSGHVLVTANLECHYLSQLHYGQKIDLFVRTVKIGNSSFELEYAVQEKNSGSIAAVGRGTIVYFDQKNNKSHVIPEDIKEIITQYEDDKQTENV